VKHLRDIADKEKIVITDGALELIALHGDGSFRDSISLLDQLRSLTDEKEGITEALVEVSLGLAPTTRVDEIVAAYEQKDLGQIVALLDASERDGIQTTVLAHQLIQILRERITAKPQLIELLDQLLDVNKSSQPNIKLLAVLGSHAVPKPKAAALAAPTHEVSATVTELEQQAVKPHPKMPAPTPKPAKAPAAKTPAARQETPTETLPEGPITLDNFNWDNLIEYTRQHYVAIYSVLSKCGYELDQEKLTLYTVNAFYKKKLDDSKHRINLSKALIETGVGNIAIETIGTPPPPKDSQAAAVAAIMGGGEEVSVA
jgi:DNA polymerase-3 subunit gamma/tau